MAENYLVRDAGYVMVRSGDGLLLNSWKQGPVARLNRTAALTWLLCDGTLRRREIVQRLRELYPERAAEVGAEVPGLLDELLAEGRLRRLAIAGERRVLRVSFRGLWPSLDPGDNYLTWMLSGRYDVLVVEEGSIPDLAIVGADATDAEAVSWDRDRTLMVYVGPAAGAESSEVDVALVQDGADGDGRLHLPPWVFVTDWRKDLAGLPNAEHLAAFMPQRFGERLFATLEKRIGEVEPLPSPEGASECSPGREPRDPGREPRERGREPEPDRDRGRLRDPEGPRLTVGMAVYDDYDGVYFTVQALVLNHPEIAAEIEILIVDNQPGGASSAALERLAGAVSSKIAGTRYIAFGDYQGTAVRDAIFRWARAPIVLCMDSHVLLPPGSLRRLVDFLETRPDCDDLLQGPLFYDDHRTLSTHFDPIWSAGMFGVWGTDERGLDPDAPPFEIPMQGLGVFACRRRAWPGFNPRFRGFGGEEGYLHEKFRQQGGRTLCLPFLRWIHRFERPGGIRFPNIWEERIRNYLIGHAELDLPATVIESHFRELLGDQVYLAAEAATQAEMSSPWWIFDAVYGIGADDDQDRQGRFQEVCGQVGLGGLLRWPSDRPPATLPADLRSVWAHRWTVERAMRLELDSVVLIECPEDVDHEHLTRLGATAEAACQGSWSVAMLGDESDPTIAVAYHRRIYRRICDELPSDPAGLVAAIRNQGGSLAAYLKSVTNGAI